VSEIRPGSSEIVRDVSAIEPIPDNLEATLEHLKAILVYLNEVRWQLSQDQKLAVKLVMLEGGWRWLSEDERERAGLD
jgi:hypothetical protein